MDFSTAFQQIGIALGLGLLVGLQRESVASPLAGLRTFAMVTLLGTVTAMLSAQFGGWILAAGFLGVVVLLAIGNIVAMRAADPDPGLTTEVAMLLMFAAGALLPMQRTALAIVIGGGVAVLLQSKASMKRFAGRLGESDLTAIMRFALIALVILPVLPNRQFGPFSVLNIYEIWLMVVLIVGISLGGYIAAKFLGDRAGVIVGGILGGLISSTATTVSYAKRTKNAAEMTPFAAIVIVIASAVVLVRVLVEIAVAGPSLLASAWPRIGALLVLFAAIAVVLWLRGRRDEVVTTPQENPTELRPALVFALLYAIVLIAVAAAQERFGSGGLYAIALLSGLTDVDAITLSTSRLVELGNIAPDLGWRAIVLASLSNLVFKAGVVAVLGQRKLFAIVASLYAVVAVAGVGLLVFS